jgi:MtN3 and saliva related transmembrane protein
VKEIVAVIFGLGLVGNAILFVPQGVAVWRKKSDEGISLITFGGFSILVPIWRQVKLQAAPGVSVGPV